MTLSAYRKLLASSAEIEPAREITSRLFIADGGRDSRQAAFTIQELCLQVCDPFVEESVIRAGGLEFFADAAVFVGEFPDSAFECADQAKSTISEF
jgi:hypothetical protein